jgi:hypothetical protein
MYTLLGAYFECLSTRSKSGQMCFLTFWTYGVRKLLMSRRVDLAILIGKRTFTLFYKEGFYSEGKVVIATEGRFYGLTDTINSSEVNETRHGGLVTRYAIRETRSWTELTHSGSSLIYSGS